MENLAGAAVTLIDDKLIDGQEALLMEKYTVLEQLKHELHVHAADQQDMTEKGLQGAECVSSGNKMKGKDDVRPAEVGA